MSHKTAQQSTIPMADPDESAWLALSDLEWFGPNVEPEVFDRRVTDLYERLKFLRDVLPLNIADSVSSVMYSIARAFATVVYVCQQHARRYTAGQSTGRQSVDELSMIMAEIIGQSVAVMKSLYPDSFRPAREVTLEDLEGWLKDEQGKRADLWAEANVLAQSEACVEHRNARIRLSQATIDQLEAEIALIKLQRQTGQSTDHSLLRDAAKA